MKKLLVIVFIFVSIFSYSITIEFEDLFLISGQGLNYNDLTVDYTFYYDIGNGELLLKIFDKDNLFELRLPYNHINNFALSILEVMSINIDVKKYKLGYYFKEIKEFYFSVRVNDNDKYYYENLSFYSLYLFDLEKNPESLYILANPIFSKLVDNNYIKNLYLTIPYKDIGNVIRAICLETITPKVNQYLKDNNILLDHTF